MSNYSKQREEVLEVLKNSYNHPTAEEIYLILKSNNSKSSRSTVYRNLNLLQKENIIKKIPMSDGPERYDYFKKPHNHIICANCGKVVDFNFDFSSRQIIDAIKEDTNMDTNLRSITVEGICSSCNTSQNIKI